jgi:transporter family-2 protein
MNSASAVVNIVIVGLIGGLAVGLQGPLSGAISQRTGPLGSSLVIHAGGAVITAVLILFVRGVDWVAMKALPWPYFFTGLFGVILYFTLAFTLPRAGVGITMALLILGQMGLGLLMDHYGWLGVPIHPVNWSRLAGMGAILAGAYLVSK